MVTRILSEGEAEEMEVQRFLDLIECLTGKPVSLVGEEDKKALAKILREDGHRLDCTQMNELLLLVNKDRMEVPFFDHFFGRGCMIADLPTGIEKFQKTAMLCYGGFVYAFRTLSRFRDKAALEEELHPTLRQPKEIIDDFQNRSEKVLEIEPISKDKTFLVGYLSAQERIDDRTYAKMLAELLPIILKDADRTWQNLEKKIEAASDDANKNKLLRLLHRYRKRFGDQMTISDLDGYLKNKAIPMIEGLMKELKDTQTQATRNQDVYLTWDHMDVYFATSMRKRWEYEDLFSFVNELMTRRELAELRLRYFDPTQSFTNQRVNKGLVEALMLKRAKCTVYSVQDADTLGKDSELAATLAQGKPVITYVPTIEPTKRTVELSLQSPLMLQERLRFLVQADGSFSTSLGQQEVEFLQNCTQILDEHEQRRVWRSLPDMELDEEFRKQHSVELQRLCRMIAESEKRLYDSRANSLRKHPLAIQVNLETGVANGVLIVRTIEQCATVLRGVLTNSLEFEIENCQADKIWYLKEKVSGSIYRVVTQDRRLTNCFWNFYRRK